MLRRWSRERLLLRWLELPGSIRASCFGGDNSCVSAPAPAFTPVAIVPEGGATPQPGSSERAGVIEVEFATGGRMRITGPVPAPTVTALMKALAKGQRRR